MTQPSFRDFPSTADDPADEPSNDRRADRYSASAVVVATMMMVVHDRRRRWRRRDVVVARTAVMHGRAMMVHRSWGASVVAVSSVWRGKAGSCKRQAGEDRSEGFHGLVHITPSLSFLFLLCASRAYILQGMYRKIS